MGLTASSLNLTQYDVEEVQEHCGGRFNHREIQTLYKRFRSLDKRHKGYLSEDELMSIPQRGLSVQCLFVKSGDMSTFRRHHHISVHIYNTRILVSPFGTSHKWY